MSQTGNRRKKSQISKTRNWGRTKWRLHNPQHHVSCCSHHYCPPGSGCQSLWWVSPTTAPQCTRWYWGKFLTLCWALHKCLIWNWWSSVPWDQQLNHFMSHVSHHCLLCHGHVPCKKIQVLSAVLSLCVSVWYIGSDWDWYDFLMSCNFKMVTRCIPMLCQIFLYRMLELLNLIFLFQLKNKLPVCEAQAVLSGLCFLASGTKGSVLSPYLSTVLLICCGSFAFC